MIYTNFIYSFHQEKKSGGKYEGEILLVTQLCLTFVTPETVTCSTSLSMGFSMQDYWGGSPFPSPEDCPDPGIEPRSPALQADSLPSETPGKPIQGSMRGR